ncbi:MAG TPA: hypothetical protein ENI90_04200 [Methylothermaceae bacterium]|nr:hypothetical protein [Methylothermaceae bacterium]
MNQLQLLAATRILEHTMPVTSRRILIYGAITLALLFAVLAGAGTFFGLASLSDNPGFWGQIGAIVGLIAALYGLKAARPLLFYHIELMQWAAVTKRAEGESLPAGKEQLEFLRTQVQALFPDAKAAFSLRRRLQQAVCAFVLQLPPSSRLNVFPEALGNALAAILAGFGADALIAAILHQGKLSAWRRALAAFCQHYPVVFRNILLSKAFMYLMLLIAFWLMLKPVGWVDEALPTDMGIWKYVFAAILTYWIKTAFLNPIVTTALILTLIPLAKEADEAVLEEWQPRIPVLSQLPAD